MRPEVLLIQVILAVASMRLGGPPHIAHHGSASSGAGGTVTVLDVYLFGDSIVDGGALANTSHRPEPVLESLLSAVPNLAEEVYNRGVSGNTIDDCQTRWDAAIATIASAGRQGVTVMLLQCGSNGSGSIGAGTTIWATQEEMLEAARSAGIRVLPATIIPRANLAEIEVANGLMRAWGVAEGVEVADTYAVLDDASDPGTLRVDCQDGDVIHPDTACTAEMVGVWFEAGREAGYW